MKKIILRYGSFGGGIVAAVLVISTAYCTQTGQYEGNMLIGYAAMLLAFSLIFVALKQVRDTQYGGIISFGKAFKAALLVTLVTATIYVAAWLVCYYFFMPDFMDKYTAYMLSKAKTDGLSRAELSRQTAQMQAYSAMYKNPLFVILLTYAEILPVGILVSLIAALLIKRKNNGLQNGEAYAIGNA